MFIVIFEVWPRPERREEYLRLAGELAPTLIATDGFVDNERFTSTRSVGKVLSISTWKDEQSLVRWRMNHQHKTAQQRGRSGVFHNYRLRVGEVTYDSGLFVATRRDDESDGLPRVAATTIELLEAFGTEGDDAQNEWTEESISASQVAAELFESIVQSGKRVWLASEPRTLEQLPLSPPKKLQFRHRLVRVIRDYGMFERNEAPQRLAPVRPDDAIETDRR
jgi:heme-degrading monooxygenase HmoA